MKKELIKSLKLFLVFSAAVGLVFSWLLPVVIFAQTEDSQDQVPESEVGEEETAEGETAEEAESSEEEAGSDQSVINELNRQIEEQQKKIDELTDKINRHKKNISRARNEIVSLQNQIYIIDNQIAKTNLDIKAKQAEIETTELEIEKVKEEIKKTEAEISKEKERLSGFIRRLHRYDEQSYLSVLLGNESFSEFFNQIKNLEGIQNNLQKTLNRVQESAARLTGQKKELDKKKERFLKLLEKLEEQKMTLISQKGTKNYLIVETRESEENFQGLVSELRQEKIAVNSQIASLERKLRQELEKRGPDEAFNLLGEAALIWPVNSRRITAYFHDPDYPFRHLFEHSGIDFGIPVGTPVKAAEAGYVAKTAVNTRWYGTYTMIIHNNNLATLYAHLSGLSVSPDQYVTQGQVIGHSGNTGFSTGPHLHFEIRLNGIPVNPLSYLP